jgi:hypothetical protein
LAVWSGVRVRQSDCPCRQGGVTITPQGSRPGGQAAIIDAREEYMTYQEPENELSARTRDMHRAIESLKDNFFTSKSPAHD